MHLLMLGSKRPGVRVSSVHIPFNRVHSMRVVVFESPPTRFASSELEEWSLITILSLKDSVCPTNPLIQRKSKGT